MAVGFRIKDATNKVLISSETTTMLMHDAFTETGYGAKSKVYTDIFSGAVLYVTATWALNANAYNTYHDNVGFAGFISTWTSLNFSYSYTVAANGDYTLNYNCILHNQNISTSIYSMTDFHLKVFVK
mgnify:CR=1 FL=1|jgi:hypothetical protein